MQFQIEETSREREERLKGWEKFLESDKSSKVAADGSTTLPADNGHLENKADIDSESAQKPDTNVHQASNTEAKEADGDAASTDSSIGGSDEEDEKGQL